MNDTWGMKWNEHEYRRQDTSNAMNGPDTEMDQIPYYADPKDESLRTPLRSRDIKSTLRIYMN